MGAPSPDAPWGAPAVRRSGRRRDTGGATVATLSTAPNPTRSDVDDLAAAVAGPVLLPDDPAFAAEVGGYNLGHVVAPAVVVGATCTADVVAAVQWAARRAQGRGAGDGARMGDRHRRRGARHHGPDERHRHRPCRPHRPDRRGSALA